MAGEQHPVRYVSQADRVILSVVIRGTFRCRHIPVSRHIPGHIHIPVSDLPKSTNFDIGALCPDIPESMRKDCSIM